MSDIDTSGGGSHKKGGKKSRKKSSNKIDFTPMVDLGFLLITFFMLTTSMSKPKTMEIQKPKDEHLLDKDKNKLNAAQALTLLLTKNDRIVYYAGLMNDPQTGPVKPQIIGYGPDQLRKLLNEENHKRNPKADSIIYYKKQAERGAITMEAYKADQNRIFDEFKAQALFVLIKTDDNARYKNLVDVLDEMSITNIRSYAIVDMIPQETQMAAALVK